MNQELTMNKENSKVEDIGAAVNFFFYFCSAAIHWTEMQTDY